MKKEKMRVLMDASSTMGLYMLTVLSLGATCALALMRSPRLPWTIAITLLLLILIGVNHMRIRARFKTLHGHGIHKRRRSESKQQR